jgi:hypothetical protein
VNARTVTWETVVALVNGKQMQVRVEIDLEEFARNYVLKAEASSRKQIKPCGGSAVVKVLGYPTRG